LDNKRLKSSPARHRTEAAPEAGRRRQCAVETIGSEHQFDKNKYLAADY
jgi:hypothetical protein